MTMQRSAGRIHSGSEPMGVAFVYRTGYPHARRKPARASELGAEHVHSAIHAGLPDLERALVNPAAVFAAPWAVISHPRLMAGCKREILRRWAWDEYLKEVAASEGMADGEPSRLDEVKAALLSLDEVWRPKPSAPTAAAALLGHHLELVAA